MKKEAIAFAFPYSCALPSNLCLRVPKGHDLEPAGELKKAIFLGSETRLVSLDLQQIDLARTGYAPSRRYVNHV